MAKKCSQLKLDEQCLRQAQSASGCHANTAPALASCEHLVNRGLAYRGPYPNLGGHPVFFAIDRNWHPFV